MPPFDNLDAGTGSPDTELYLYGPPPGGGAPRLVCASCNPTGERPKGSASIPGAEVNGSTLAYRPRALASSGNRVFFETSDRLVIGDSDNRPDVYEWEAGGEGSCGEPEGCVGLVSGGRGSGGSFLDASADGGDVYFSTEESLVHADPGAIDVYDYRVGGGFPEPAEPIICVGDSVPAAALGPRRPEPGHAVPALGQSGAALRQGTQAPPAQEAAQAPPPTPPSPPGEALMPARHLVLAACLAALAALATPVAARAAFGFRSGGEGFEVAIRGEGGAPDTEAGSHPVALEASVDFNLQGAGPFSDGDVKNLELEMPPGLIENPTVLPTCSPAAFQADRSSPWEESLSGESCPDRTQVGLLTVRSARGGGETRSFGLFNLTPPPGVLLELGANPYGSPIVFVPSLRQAEGEYGTTLRATQIPQTVDVTGLTLTVWGVPWAAQHNAQRGNCLNEAEPGFGWTKCSPGPPSKAENAPRPYLTLPTSCEGPLAFGAAADSWQGSARAERGAQAPALSGCATLGFEPRIAAQLSDPRASSPSGYVFDVDVDQSGLTDPARRAASPLRRAVVALPEGVTINPSVGSGLGVCAPVQYAAETAGSAPGAGCPNESKIGDFEVRSPIVPETVKGAVFLAAPGDNPFGSLLAIYLVAKAPQRGVLVKVAGELAADPRSGRLTATFDKLPQLPYSQLEIHFREGQRSPLATPPACGTFQTSADLTPWRDASLVVHDSLPLQIGAGPGGGPCPSGTPPFAPQVSGGSLNSRAGAYSPFYLHLTRTDAEQEITSYSATFPPGVLGKLAGVPYCPEAAIAAAATRSGREELERPDCPEASRIGRTVAGYGVGTVPTYAPGGLYLAGPYRGSQLSVVAIDSAIVGPFDLGTVVVRSAIRVDPATAQASIDAAGTDPIPHILDGIPIHLRDLRIYVDRPGFMLNPTSCDASRISSALNGSGADFGTAADDSLAVATAPYQAFDCSSLGFRPRISLRAKGGTRRGARPMLRLVYRPRRGDANSKVASVALPPSLFLDTFNIDKVCTRPRFAAGDCPKGSIYGRVKAWTPLLDAPLSGPAYLRSSGHTLPDLVFALRGEGFEVDLAGRIDSFKGGIRGTFPMLPDAPVTKFELRLPGGRHGLLQNSANLCAGPQLATARLLGQANRGWAFHPALKARCRKGKHRHRKRSGGHRNNSKGAGR